MKLAVSTFTLTMAATLSFGVIQNNAFSSGFALIEFGGSGMGNAYAGAAAVAEDASTVQFNPAGMVLLEGSQLVGALHVILPSADFKDQASTSAALLGSSQLSGHNDDGGRNAFVPNLYYVTDINEKMKFGFGMNTSFGLATKYDDNWIGRYHAVESDVATVNFNPSISYKVDEKLSYGVGITAQYIHVTLSSAIDMGAICFAALGATSCGTLGLAPQSNDGFVKLTGENWAFGWNAGVLYQLSNATRVGLAYRSEMTQEVTGDADFSIPGSAVFATSSGAFIDTGLSADVTLPDSLSLSVYHTYNDTWAVLADISWTGWKDFEELRVVYDSKVLDAAGAVVSGQPDSLTTEAWRNSLRYALGVNYRKDEKLLLRAGLAYDATPIPNAERRTPRVSGNDRSWLSFGAQYKVDKSWVFDIAYSHLFINKTKINNEFESSIPTLAATLNGEYSASVDILSTQLSLKF